jgi:hypothetical protein
MKNDTIREYVMVRYIETCQHIFISDIATALGTNAAKVRAALDEQLNGFEYYQADKASGTSFTRRYIQAWCVEPSKRALVERFTK